MRKLKSFQKENLGIKTKDSRISKKKFLSIEDSNEESSDPNEEEERLFMVEIVNIPKSESSEF